MYCGMKYNFVMQNLCIFPRLNVVSNRVHLTR